MLVSSLRLDEEEAPRKTVPTPLQVGEHQVSRKSSRAPLCPACDVSVRFLPLPIPVPTAAASGMGPYDPHGAERVLVCKQREKSEHVKYSGSGST